MECEEPVRRLTVTVAVLQESEKLLRDGVQIGGELNTFSAQCRITVDTQVCLSASLKPCLFLSFHPSLHPFLPPSLLTGLISSNLIVSYLVQIYIHCWLVAVW